MGNLDWPTYVAGQRQLVPGQAEANIELTLSASPATAVGQSKLTQANLGKSTVEFCDQIFEKSKVVRNKPKQ